MKRSFLSLFCCKMVKESFADRFGQKERTGMGGRSRVKDLPQDSSERVRQRLLSELSELRGHHESLQRQRDDIQVSCCDPGRFDANMFGDNAGKVERGESLWGQLGDGDKDAIEALFASDDFAEMFNAGAGHVSRLHPLTQPPRNAEKPTQLAAVCHLCAKRLAPSDIAAYVSKTFDPTKPSRRRHPK